MGKSKKKSKHPFAALFKLFDVANKERRFLLIITTLFMLCALLYPYPQIAMWLGFVLAAYSAVANDSIQTIGTFIASNSKRKWYVLWMFIGGIFLVTVLYSWYKYSGDVTYQRLASKGFAKAPTEFHFLQVAAPVFLLIITRMRMPVSTTFLLLSSFATSSGAIGSVLQKSLMGYLLAFGLGMLVWALFSRLMKRYFKGKAHPLWSVAQWITSGTLWSVWIMQDAANIAVFLPRSLNVWQFAGFAGTIFLGLGLLFYLKGDRIQKIVNEKSTVKDVRAATIIDFVYALILFFFKIYSKVPMSTTWVFIGLLGGRELAMSLMSTGSKSVRDGLRMILKDVSLAMGGLLVSIILAFAVNKNIQEEVLSWFGF